MNQYRTGNSFPKQGVPGDPRLLGQLQRQTPKPAGMAVRHTHSGVNFAAPKKSRKGANTPPPWWPTLHKEGEGEAVIYKVSVKKGWITESLRKSTSDGLIRHFPTNLEEGGEGDPPSPITATKFTIAADEVLYVKYDVEIDGSITADSVTLEVAEDEVEANPFQPKAGDFAGSTGDRYVPLCQLKVEGESVSLVVINTGHIGHSSERPEINNTVEAAPDFEDETGSDYARPVKEYDPLQDKFKLRVHVGRDIVDPPVEGEPTRQAQVIEENDRIIHQGNSKVFSVTFAGPGADEDNPLDVNDGYCTNDDDMRVQLPEFISSDGSVEIAYDSGTEEDPKSEWDLKVANAPLVGDTFAIIYWNMAATIPGGDFASAFEPDTTDGTPDSIVYFLDGVAFKRGHADPLPTGYPDPFEYFHVGIFAPTDGFPDPPYS